MHRRQSVICHTKDISDASGAEDLDDRSFSKSYSIHHILSSISRSSSDGSSHHHHHHHHHRERRISSSQENKDSGFEDDDELSAFESANENQNIALSSKSTSSAEIHQHKEQQHNLLERSYSDESFNPLTELSKIPLSMSDIQNFTFSDPKSEDFKRRFESSVLSALRDPQIQYLLTLYSFIDEDLLKGTLTNFLNGSSLDNSTLNAAENYLQNPSLLSEEINNNNNKEPKRKSELLDFVIQQKKQHTHQEQGNTEHIDTSNKDLQHRHGIKHSNALQQQQQSDLSSTSLPKTSNLQNNKSTSSEIQCEYCQKMFSNRHSLARHLRTHEGTRSHKCSKCSRSFYDQPSYLRHVRSHNGDKKHKCEQCSMAFNKRSALQVHIRTHTGERPFVCEYCGKGFSISGNLHRHVLIHTRHRPYKCGKCPRAFNNPSHLARHINSFHT